MKEKIELALGVIGVFGLACICPSLFVCGLIIMGTIAIAMEVK